MKLWGRAAQRQSFHVRSKQNYAFPCNFYLAIYCIVYFLFCCCTTVQSYEVTVLNTANQTSQIRGWLTKRYVDGLEEPNSTMGWAQVSIPAIGWRIFQICPPPHNNNFQLKKVQSWLRSPLMKVKDVSRLYIDLQFWMRECFDLDDTICRETFKVSYKFANESNSNADNLLDDNYTTIDTVAAEERFLPNSDHSGFEVNKETVSVQISLEGQKSNDGIYVAVVDEGACMSLKSLRVYYKMCPKKIAKLAEFPKTHTGQFDTSLVEVTGKCVPNSMPALNDDLNAPSLPLYHCTSSGIWQVTKGTCQCKKGYEPDSLRFKCIPCSPNFYKSSTSNNLCTPCPPNSYTNKQASFYCMCSSDHIQFNSTNNVKCDTCSKLPSVPLSLKLVPGPKKSTGVVELKWKPPQTTGGCHKLYYCVFCQSCSAPNMDDFTTSLNKHAKNNSLTQTECNPYDRNNKSLANRNCQIVQNSVVFQNLKAESCYQFVVLSITGVTKQQYSREFNYLSNKQMNFSDELTLDSLQISKILKSSSSVIEFHTNITTPSIVTGLIVLNQNESSCFIKWSKPKYTGKNEITYQVKWMSVDRSGRSTGDLSRMLVNSTSAVLSGLRAGVTYKVLVRAKNIIGNGQYSEMLMIRTSPAPINPVDQNSNYIYLIAAISLICVLVLIFSIAWFKCNPNKHAANENGNNIAHYTEGTHFSSLTDLTEQRTYVDPFLLGAVNHHNFICETSPNLISVLNVIGCGEFGEVYQGTLTQQDCEEGPEIVVDVAVKRLHAQCTPNEQIDFLREAMALERFKHPNIVKLEAVVTSTRPFMICTELMDHGCLGAFLRQHREKEMIFDANVLVGMMLGVANGMAYLSRLNYVHRDLAARNVLINSSLVCKVSDFGLTRNLSKTNKEKELCPSYTTQGGKIAIRWTAPESVAYQFYSQASDIWSFGVFAWEVVTYGEKPYWNLTNQQVLQAVNEGFRLPAPEDCPSVIHQLMLQCWLRDRQSRPTFVQIVNKLNQMLNNSESLEILASPASTGADHMFFTESPPHTPLPIPTVTEGQSHHDYATCRIVQDQSLNQDTDIHECTTLLADSLIKETSLSDSSNDLSSSFLLTESEPNSSTISNNNNSCQNGSISKSQLKVKKV